MRRALRRMAWGAAATFAVGLVALAVIADRMFDDAKQRAQGAVTLRFFSETSVPTRLLLVVIYDQYDMLENRVPGGVELRPALADPAGVTTTPLAAFAQDQASLPNLVFFRHRRAGDPLRREDGRAFYRESRVPVWLRARRHCEAIVTIHDDRIEHAGCDRAD